jgi:hypothetical protein
MTGLGEQTGCDNCSPLASPAARHKRCSSPKSQDFWQHPLGRQVRIAVRHVERLPSPVHLQLLQVFVDRVVPRCPAMPNHVQVHMPVQPCCRRRCLERPVYLCARDACVNVPGLTIAPLEHGPSSLAVMQPGERLDGPRLQVDDPVLDVAVRRLDLAQRGPGVLHLDIFSSPVRRSRHGGARRRT